MSRKSSRKAGRVVRYRLKDGTLQVKRYAPYEPKDGLRSGDTVAHLIGAWERSPKFRKLARRTQDQYTTYLRHLSSMHNVLVRRVSRRELLDLRDAVAQARGHGAAIGFARAVSALFSFAVDREVIEHSPATRLQRDLERGHLPAWTPVEAALALAALPEHLRRAVVLALFTGQRRGDLIALRWAQYDGRVIRLTQQKTRVALTLPVLPELKAELDAWRSGPVAPHPDRTILVNKFGRQWNGSNLSNQLSDALAAIPGFPPRRNIHGVRKLAATNFAQAGCTPHEIGAITGHKTLAMVQLYTESISQERAAQAAVAKLTAKQRNLVV